MITPTLNMMLNVYIESAAIERLRCGRPSEGTVKNTRVGLRKFQSWASWVVNPEISTVETEAKSAAVEISSDIITPKNIRKYLAFLLSSNIKPVSAISFINQLQQLFAKWVRPYYEDQGWSIPNFPTVSRRVKSARYKRPSQDQLCNVKNWYKSLPNNMLWYVATMMLEFAMRNGDIERLKRENFIYSNGRMYLNYTPHKTANSSGRTIKWPIHPDIWEMFEIIQPWKHPITESLFSKLNSSMRSLGFTGTKGAYELRKICIDHVYQTYGAEMATSISGDDIKTIIRYYADPAQPNLENIRITDLL